MSFRERIASAVFLALAAFAAVYLVAHVAAASIGLPTYSAGIAALAASVYTGASLYREARR